MPPQDGDDYVVSLLLKDSEANKKRYLSNSGLGSLLSKRPRGNAPKPNTRFLKSIVKEADSHNAALKAKEEEESRVRLRDLKRKREDVDRGEAGKKRAREDRVGGERPGRWASALAGLSSKPGREEDRSRHRDRRREKSRERDRDRRSHRRRDDSRSRSRSPETRHRKERRRRSRSRTPPPRHRSRDSDRSSDSDPLETILGRKPAPTILPRGRGAHKPHGSNIDTRFSASYNPKTDVRLSDNEAEGDDWDMALEALKDRAKWRAQGAERLRQAGFTEKEVERWEGSAAFPSGGQGGEKDVGDVRWSKKGEDREWDRGKVVGEESVELKPTWARAKE